VCVQEKDNESRLSEDTSFVSVNFIETATIVQTQCYSADQLFESDGAKRR